MINRQLEEPQLEVEHVLPILDQIAIFGGLSSEQLREIVKRLKLIRFDAGETIFRAGDSASYLYIVESGQVDLFFELGQTMVRKASFSPGACFGDISVIGIQPHSATTIAVSDARLLILSGEALDDIYQSDKQLFAMLVLNIAREACRRLHKTNHQLVNCLSQYPDAVVEIIQGY